MCKCGEEAPKIEPNITVNDTLVVEVRDMLFKWAELHDVEGLSIRQVNTLVDEIVRFVHAH